MSCRPRLQFFSTQRARYVYDAPTGRILECDSLTASLLPQCGDASDSTVLAQFTPDVADNVRERLAVVRSLQEKEGVFRPASPFTFKHVEDATSPLADLRQVVLEVTDRCNLSCDYCCFANAYPSFRNLGAKRMTLSTALDAVDMVMQDDSGDGMLYVTFFGGEPFLEYQLMQRVMEAIATRYPGKTVHYNVTTNGTIMNDAIVDMLTKYPVSIWVSLDGPRHLHDLHRKSGATGRGSYDRVLQTLRTIRDRCGEYYLKHVHFVCVLTPPLKLRERAAFFASMPELPPNFMLRVEGQVMLGLCQEDREAWATAFAELDQEWEVYKDRIAHPEFTGEVRASRENRFWESIYGREVADIINRPVSFDGAGGPLLRTECLQTLDRLFVNAEGDVYLCIPSTYYRDGRFKLGSVRDGVDEATTARIMDEWRRFRERECSQCWAARLCKVCFALLPWEEQKEFCKAFRVKCIKWMSRVAELRESRPDICELYAHALDTFTQQRVQEIKDGFA